MRRILAFIVALAVPSGALANNITTTTCTPTVQTGCVFLPLSSFGNVSSVSVQVTGTWSGTLVFEGSNDASTYVLLRGYGIPDHDPATVYVTGTTANGAWSVDPAGLIYFRVRATALASGTAVVSVQPSTSAPTSGAVNVGSPDGGLYMTLGAQRVAVEATGPAGGDVPIAGTVGFDTAATALLSAATCTEYPLDWQSVGSAAASPIPPDLPDGGSGGLEGRTSILIVNTDSTTRVACGVMTTDGGLPQWGVRGDPLSPNAGWAEYPVKSNVRVYCRAQTGVSTFMSPKEKICSK